MAGEDSDTSNGTGVIAHAASGGYDGLVADLTVSVADNDDPAAGDTSAAWLGRFKSEQVLEGIRNRITMRRDGRRTVRHRARLGLAGVSQDSANRTSELGVGMEFRTSF